MASTGNISVNTTGGPLLPPVSLICAGGSMRSALVSILAIMMVFAIFGNVVLITSIWRTPKLRTRTNCFIFNLACADLAVALVCMPFSLVTCYLQRWVFGYALCQVNGFMNILFGGTSLLTLSAISLEKYFSIVRAMHHVITKRRTVYMLLVTWTVPAVFAVMPLIGFTSYRLNPGSTQCSTETPLRTPSQMIHVVFMFLFSFLLPLCIIGVSYFRIFGAARRHSQRMGSGSVTSTSIDSLNSISTHKQIAVTVFIMIIVFVICWSPFFVYLMYLVTNRIRVQAEGTRILVLASYWLAFLNSALNPCIYGVRNPQLRRVVRSSFSSLLGISESSRETRRYGPKRNRVFDARGDVDMACGTTHPAALNMALRKGQSTKQTEEKHRSDTDKTSPRRAKTSCETSAFDHPLPIIKKGRASSWVCLAKSSVGSLGRRISSPGYINVVELDDEQSSKQIYTLKIEQTKLQGYDKLETENKPANSINERDQ